MGSDLKSSLSANFGFHSFRPGQEEAIQSIMDGKNALVVMPTGAGKSLVYQFAALHQPGVTLVISPLIALMKDQVESLDRHRIPATYINSALQPAEQTRRLQELAKGEYRLAYVAPERLRSVSFQQAVSRISVGLLAVDEAHCISEWGHDFRPDYLHIAAFWEQIGRPVTTALTATATVQVQDEIVRLLGLTSAERIVTGFNRPNLSFRVLYAREDIGKLQALRDLLKSVPDGGSIVYVGTRREAEETSDFIRDVIGIESSHYHAGLDPEIRNRVQDKFISGKLPVVVATNAFGMGIDRPDVRLVAHYSLPATLEAYYQEAGRAGRDGQPARAALIYSPKDRALQEFFIGNDAPDEDEMREIYRALQTGSKAEGWTTTDGLSLSTGLEQVRAKVGLSQLERAGVIERLGDEGQRMLVRLNDWDQAAVTKTILGLERRQRYRFRQLDQMVAYAESNDCRRRIMLDYFGDRSPADAEQCCDNCMVQRSTAEPQTLPKSDLTALFILDCLRRIKWEVGRIKLAQILKGSKAQDISRFGYDKNRHYGRLKDLSLDEIKNMIDQLTKQSYIKTIGGSLPVLSLTPKGEEAVRARTAIPLKRSVLIQTKGNDEIAVWMGRSHPKPLSGPWHAGWALGFHSRFAGSDWSRSGVGDLAFRLKYKSDFAAVQPLVKEIMALFAEHPELKDVDALVPVPPSTARPFDPVKIMADALSRHLRVPVAPALTRNRRALPQKQMNTLAQKRANVAKAFAVQGEITGKRLLLLDDLFDSGATLEEAANMLTKAGAGRICVLTLTRTIHSDA
ncbi:MAG TPA: RecQ family ATP-dependent DNA helicase [Armatimonadota bacterium]|nr:RecQ family ATP-dependent DNA helicase [Armatimonadota bacterium]